MELAKRLNIKLAWERTKIDYREQTFVQQAFQRQVTEFHIDDWLDSIRESVRNGSYKPSYCRIADIPKPGGHIRPGGVLVPEDTIVYSALLLDAIEEIKESLKWSNKENRFSNILLESQTSDRWVETGTQNWVSFKNKAIREAEICPYTVQFDIAAFYENIDIKTISSDLEFIGIEGDTLNLLTVCLFEWTGPRRRGIPQGFLPSSILSEVYLDTIDLSLKEEGIEFVRYVDDGFIFCSNELDAIKNMHFLTRALRDKGLNLQTAKTRILDQEKALDVIRDKSVLVEHANDKIKAKVEEIGGLSLSYAPPFEIEKFLRKKGISLRVDELRKLFDSEIILHLESFNKSLFHYILYKMKSFLDDYQFNIFLNLIAIRPEETKHILNYLKAFKFSHKEEIERRFVRYLSIDSRLIEYQRYTLVKWILEERFFSKDLVSVVRKNLAVNGISIWYRDYILAYLGKYGNASDLARIERIYETESNSYSKAAIICSLRELPKGRRNELYSKAQSKDYIVKLAVEWAKSNKSY